MNLSMINEKRPMTLLKFIFPHPLIDYLETKLKVYARN